MNIFNLEEYLPIIIFCIVAFGLAFFLLIVSFIRSKHKPNVHKNSPYECGFSSFDKDDNNSRKPFDVHFYLVAILFIIFDVEIAFLFPWAISLQKIGWVGFFSMVGFLFTLSVGFVYELKKKALDWK